MCLNRMCAFSSFFEHFFFPVLFHCVRKISSSLSSHCTTYEQSLCPHVSIKPTMPRISHPSPNPWKGEYVLRGRRTLFLLIISLQNLKFRKLQHHLKAPTPMKWKLNNCTLATTQPKPRRLPLPVQKATSSYSITAKRTKTKKRRQPSTTV